MNESITDSSEMAPASQDEAAYRVLARKYRPQDFSQLVGQDALVRTVTNAIREDRIAHAFILTGVRGVGKTTTARIIARSLNCIGPGGSGGPTAEPCGVCEHCLAIAESRHVDVLEMDAASRTGVDNMRELLDGVRYLPATARFKVYIIDEVHMLSLQAFNALLKTLEEPPEHVKFIFATTEIRKLPVTVLSRCQRFDLRRVGAELLVEHFAGIVDAEGASADAEALNMIAAAAEGSVRDGLSLLDQAIAHGGGKVTAEQVRAMLGLADRLRVFDLFEALMRGDVAETLGQLREQYDLGADPAVILRDLLELTHLLTRLKVAPGAADDPALSEMERQRGGKLAGDLSMPVLARTWQMLLKGLGEVRTAPSALAAAEMVLIRLAYSTDLPPPIDAVRQAVEGGAAAASAASAPAPPPSSSRTGAEARGGPAAGLAEAAPSPMPEPEEAAPIDAPTAEAAPIDSFAEVVERAEATRAARLYHHLMEDVRLVAFKPGQITLRPLSNAPPDLAATLRGKLEEWTGQAWAVVIDGQAEGAPPLAEQQRRDRTAALAEAESHPLVQAVMETFPGAKVTDVRTLDGADGPADDGEPG
ncbi:MAG: DNA polymerase III subunit gamma/tau [Alphaproteobacteria bacterium]|jgi:DNA polymerase-3 subunit gamma/tau|nr:DNA polymerase III subunit gamma/tau [Alphaproteobacteria bacterium]MDP6566911.1 DNA polymerase III subunit gamma/tau [Alphaproteobacteria bacterium]MDP6813281.1 DNA polymerase III subunit gamma/tau [Alphaproteobacteria bacterium]